MSSIRYLLVLGACLPMAATAEGPDGSPGDPFEVADEPMHHIRLENDVVRVYQAMVPGDSATLYHRHSQSGIGFDMTSNEVGVETPDGASARQQSAAGGIMAIDADPPYVHRVLNFSETYFRAIVAERNSAGLLGAGPSTLAGVDGYETALETDLAVTHRLTLAPGETTGPHTLRANSLLVVITGGQLAVSEAGGESELRLQLPGELEFVATPKPVDFTNRGIVDYVAAVVEWK